MRSNIRHLQRWTFEEGKLLLPGVRLSADRFEHVVPKSIRSTGITLLTKVEAVQGHVAEVSATARAFRKGDIHNKRLENHSEIRLVIEFFSISDIHLQEIPFLDQFDVTFLLSGKARCHEAGTFDHVHRDTFLWFSLELGQDIDICVRKKGDNVIIM